MLALIVTGKDFLYQTMEAQTLSLIKMFHYVYTSLIYNGQSWKQPRCSLTEEWIQKSRYIYTMEYYLAIKNNDFMKFAGKWKKLKINILIDTK